MTDISLPHCLSGGDRYLKAAKDQLRHESDARVEVPGLNRQVRRSVGFGRLCPPKKHIMLLAVLIFFRNYAKIMPLSENYALCHRNYATYILSKIKITSSLIYQF